MSSLSFLTVSLTASFASFKASPTSFPPSLALSSALSAWSLTVSAASLTPDLASSAASLTLSAAFPAASFAPFAASSTLSLTFPKYCQIRERKGSWNYNYLVWQVYWKDRPIDRQSTILSPVPPGYCVSQAEPRLTTSSIQLVQRSCWSVFLARTYRPSTMAQWHQSYLEAGECIEQSPELEPSSAISGIKEVDLRKRKEIIGVARNG